MEKYRPKGEEALQKVAAYFSPQMAVQVLVEDQKFFESLAASCFIIAKKVFRDQGVATACDLLKSFLESFSVEFPKEEENAEFSQTLADLLEEALQASTTVERRRKVDSLAAILKRKCSFV